MWYYRNAYLPAGLKASIAGMAGPVIWMGGLAALLWLLWRQVSGRGSYAGAGLAVLYLGVLYARWRQGRPGFDKEFRTAFLGGIAFYVVLPLCI